MKNISHLYFMKNVIFSSYEHQANKPQYPTDILLYIKLSKANKPQYPLNYFRND